MYEVIDHTADIGIRVTGENLEELFIRAAEGLTDVMVASKPNLIPSIGVSFDLKADSREDLLIKWLQEILYIFDTRHLVLTHFFIDSLTETTLQGGAKGLKYDRLRHELKCQLKAITYHKLSLTKEADGWHAQVIFDV